MILKKKHLKFHTVFFIIEEIYDTNSHVKSIQLLHGFIKHISQYFVRRFVLCLPVSTVCCECPDRILLIELDNCP